MRKGLLAALVPFLVLVGCARIPTDGPVKEGDAIAARVQQPFIRVDPARPVADAEPLEIVNGYLDAMGAYDLGYETARLFLTPQAAAAWNPDEQIIVHSSARPQIEKMQDNRIRVTMQVAGVVDSEGFYVAAEPGTTREVDLTLKRSEGQWRIADPEPGVMISEFDFSREYESYNVYFFDPTREVLVPDPVHVPKNAPVATILAEELVDGPSDWLAPSVRTSIPEGTELGVNAVPTESGTALVDLSEEASSLDTAERELMTAQFAWTLTQLSSVENVEVSAKGVSLSQGKADTDREGFAGFNPNVVPSDTAFYALGESGVQWLFEGALATGAGALSQAEGMREIAVSLEEDQAAVVTGAGRELRVGQLRSQADTPLRTVMSGNGLSSPAWDRQDVLWAAASTPEGPKIMAATAEGDPLEVDAPELGRRRVDRLAVSPDGTRMALVVDQRAYIATITRDLANSRVSVSHVRPLGPAGTALDMAWSAPDSVAVVLDIAGGASLYEVGLSGDVVGPRSLPEENVRHVAAAPGNAIVVESDSGSLFERRSLNQWTDVGRGKAPTYPG